MTEKKWFGEVSYMRVLLLVLLVLFHAFAPFTGPWHMPKGFYDIELYRWIGYFSRAFRLEGFVFISGYIFTYQLIERSKWRNFQELLKNKIQRLYIPGIIFSAIYFMCFLDFEGLPSLSVSIISGVGHLWYLPCLFWCFLIEYHLVNSKLSKKWILSILFLGIIVSFIPLPFQLNKTLYYLMFFYSGGLFWQYSSTLKYIYSKKIIILSWILFLLLFFVINIVIEQVDVYRNTLNSTIGRGLCWSVTYVLKAILAGGGILSLYLSCAKYSETHYPSKTVLQLGTCGYGVYVIHQFVLVWLYSYTDFSLIIGIPLLPWVSFSITIIFSIVLTLLIRQTNIGRKYL